jgi:5-methylcytosine-specific restriction endonuclease McrA
MAYWLDDGFDTWPQVIRAGSAGVGLYVRCGCWIARNLTDGHVPAEVATMYGTPEWIRRLVEVGLWETDGQGYRDVFYFTMGNPTAETVRARRAMAARRQALTRDPALREAVRTRDRDRCRYCGVTVRWSDRKGAKGGTYDHVDPAGPNTFDNLVVCCRGCNSAKRDRTPSEAGMTLRPVPSSNLDTAQNGSRLDPVSSPPPALPLPNGRAGGTGARSATRPPDCPHHRGYPADNCGLCRSETLAADTPRGDP